MLNKPKAFFVISRYNENISWINEFNFDYIVYNKGDKIDDYNSINIENIGGNQRDIFHYIYHNYDNLPEVIGFLQANPFDHCNKEKLSKLIYNETLTPLESYDPINFNSMNRVGDDGGFMELNNNWYISAHNNHLLSKGFTITNKFSSFDSYMNSIFSDYSHVNFIRFTPGSQYIVPKKSCLYYPKEFWFKLMNSFPTQTGINGGTEAHIIERSIFMIFKNIYSLK